MRLGVLLTHPVQYYAPLFRELARRPGVDLRVCFAHRPTREEQGEGFGVAFEWDVDVTSGYEHEFLENVAREGRGTGFGGFDTPSVADRVRRGGFDAFLVMGWHARAYWQAMYAAWRAGVPLLVRGDSQLGRGDRGARGLAKRLVYPQFVGRFSACLATGTRSERYFEHYGARRVVRSTHFVDNEALAAGAERVGRDAARATLGIAPDELVIAFAGKLVERKRPLDVIEAAIAAGRRAVVLMVGDGALRSDCERAAVRAREAGVNVIFTGFMNQSAIPSAYAAADVLSLPSNDSETWGLVVNEAMACGRPAIVSAAVGCAPDLVVEGETGFVHADGDVAAMTRLFARVADDRAGLRRMGELARRRVSTFTASAAASGVLVAAERA